MNKASETLQRRFGQNLSESLGVRSASPGLPPLPRPTAAGTPRESGPDDGRTRAREAGHMELSRIVPDPDQPRKEFDDDAVERLSRSLLKHGQLMPIRVRWNPTAGKWVVISGERRYRAAVRAGLKSVACIFAEDGLSPSEILQEQVVENLLREDLKPVEQARAYRQLMEMHGWSAKDLAGELQVSQGAISKSLALLTLPEDLQAEVDRGQIAAATAYQVAKVDDPAVQRDVVRRVVEEKLTRDEVSEVVREAAEKLAPGRPSRARPPRAAAPGMATRAVETPIGRVVVTAKGEALDEGETIRILEAALALLRNPSTQ
jgi:ParB family transcriptional regulator, chromosome partitioning protein